MKKVTTAERLKYIMKKRDLRQVDILNLSAKFCKKYDVKLNKSDLSQYVSGKVEPSQEKLVILGMGLDVSESWLMGFDVPMERCASKMDTRLQKIINCYNGMTENGKEFLLTQAKVCLDQFANEPNMKASLKIDDMRESEQPVMAQEDSPEKLPLSDDDIDREVADYRRQLELERQAMEKSEALQKNA